MNTVLVVGMGEVGRPLLTILSRHYRCVGVDRDPVPHDGPTSVMHICFPSQVPDFVAETVRYIDKYRPELTIINSTVVPGTTREVQRLAGRPVAYSPVRGKHARMAEDMLRYRKFVAAVDAETQERACAHFSAAGFTVDGFRTPEIGELSKLIETTWLGILVGWAQEAERFAQFFGGSFEDVDRFIEEVEFLPSGIFPGVIGGHCVMPNIQLLQQQFDSEFLRAVVHSNLEKQRRLQAAKAKVA
jgi:UDP-N-acetyl-D-mannosaminuronate dehydrogenase